MQYYRHVMLNLSSDDYGDRRVMMLLQDVKQ